MDWKRLYVWLSERWHRLVYRETIELPLVLRWSCPACGAGRCHFIWQGLDDRTVARHAHFQTSPYCEGDPGFSLTDLAGKPRGRDQAMPSGDRGRRGAVGPASLAHDTGHRGLAG